jgi:aromatic-L-amino-acid decarboxylase
MRDPQHLIRVMSTDPSYLRTAHDGVVRNLRDWGIPLGRRFRALKLWFLLREHGVEGLRARIRRDVTNTAWLAEAVDATPEWERVAPAPLQTVCARHVPPHLAGDEDALAAHNLGIADRVNQAGRVYVTPSLLKGGQMIRVSVGAQGTERTHVALVWSELRDAARRQVIGRVR